MHQKINLFGIAIDNLTMDQTVKTIATWIDASASTCRYVVTPNVDHIVKLNVDHAFKKAYAEASLVVADGKPVVLASRLLGKPLPGTVPGSDLVPALFDYFDAANKPLQVFLLGALPGVAEKAASHINAKWSNVHVVGLFSPEFGFEKSESTSLHIAKLLNDANPDLVVFGVGAPKQEIWANQYAQHIHAKVILCVGATIDFIAGEKARAPVWVRKIGMEWLHRMLTEPRRLFKRYFYDALVFPQLVFKEWTKK